MSRTWYNCIVRTIIAAIVAGVLVAGSFGAGWAAYDQVFEYIGTAKPIPPTDADERSDEIDMRVLWEAVQLLRDHYYGEVPVQGDELTYAAIRGVLAALDDPFTAFVDPQQAQLLEEDMQGEFEGIGATVRMNEEDELMIVSPIPGSPAEKAGLQSGDVILEAAGKRLKGLSIMEAVSIIRGPRGTSIELKVLRLGEEPFTVEIVRDRIEIPTVETKVFAEDDGLSIGYLKLNNFNAHATEQLREGLRELQAEDTAGLILDLRNNPGGFLRTAIEVTGQFLEGGQVVLIERGKENEQFHRAPSGGVWLEKPLIVLVNGGSASASEIVAGAIQDHNRGTLVGTTTFGKGSVQAPYTLRDHSSLRVTVARWFTPDNREIHGSGVTPDVTVEVTPADERRGADPQLEKALELVRKEIEATS